MEKCKIVNGHDLKCLCCDKNYVFHGPSNLNINFQAHGNLDRNLNCNTCCDAICDHDYFEKKCLNVDQYFDNKCYSDNMSNSVETRNLHLNDRLMPKFRKCECQYPTNLNRNKKDTQFSLINSSLLFVMVTMSIICIENVLAHDWIPSSDSGSNRYQSKRPPTDRVLREDLKEITLFRNRLTTGRRTHPIPQLSCVGGTAGCKLFTPQEVVCRQKGNWNWSCHADMSDRVKFNHIDIICEGYEYAEDDHVLLGSCGLEFTLDYVSPNDHHEHSYFSQLDEHEKEKHHEQVHQKLNQELQRKKLQEEQNSNKVSQQKVDSIATQVAQAATSGLSLVAPLSVFWLVAVATLLTLGFMLMRFVFGNSIKNQTSRSCSSILSSTLTPSKKRSD